MNSKPTIFLDTSVQIERILGAKAKQAEIEQRLATPHLQFITSHYVFMEFQRSVIADHAHVHHQLSQCDDWEEAVIRLRSGTRAYRPRSLVRMMQIFTRTMVISQMKREIALNLLKVQIERELTKRFWRHISPSHDLITCDLVSKGTQRQDNGHFTVAESCHKATAACYLPAFLAAHKPQLHTIIDHLTTHPTCIKEQGRVERLLKVVLEKPQEALGQSACWPLGDVIIALQIPAHVKLRTLDADLIALSKALDVALYQPDELNQTSE